MADTHAADHETVSHGAADVHASDEHAHPTELFYLKVASVLFLVTAVEVGLYYTDLAKLALVLPLLALAAVKFALVAMFFMHLKFDSRLFRRFFVVGIALALTVYVVVLLTFHVFISDRNVANKPAAEGSQ